jgi:hypothetical protein
LWLKKVVLFAPLEGATNVFVFESGCVEWSCVDFHLSKLQFIAEPIWSAVSLLDLVRFVFVVSVSHLTSCCTSNTKSHYLHRGSWPLQCIEGMFFKCNIYVQNSYVLLANKFMCLITKQASYICNHVLF